jgi:ribose-phosphate pyrophosphokinase
LATHAVLAGDACDKLNSSPIDTIVVTNTIGIPQEKQFSKLKIVTVAPLFAAAITKSAAS